VTAVPVGRRTLRPRLRPAWVWRLRQVSGLVFVLWFIVAIPLTVVGLLIEPRWVGWFVMVWFLILVAFMLAVRADDARLRRAWAEVVSQLGWHASASERDLAERWPFPPFSADPDPEVLNVTTGRHRGREFWTGRFTYVVRRRRLGFDFLELEVDRPLPPLQVLPRSLAPLAAPGGLSLPLDLTEPGLAESYGLFHGREEFALAVFHQRTLDVLRQVQPFGFACEGRRFVAVLPSYRKPGSALAQLDAACDLLDLVPENVWQAGEQWAETRPADSGH
jgi:hypothetical protein